MATTTEADLEHFLRRGYLVVPSGVSAAVHQDICDRAAEICASGPNAAAILGDNVLPTMGELWEVLEAAPVQKALSTVLGEDYMLHGHRHLHISSTREQMWHKDSYWGFRKMRQHRTRWCMLLYYPQDTTLEMGPTHVLAGSQYWTVDTEGSERGEDILERESGYVDMFVEGSVEERRAQLREASNSLTQATHSHLVEDVALTVPAGSCVLMHYDLFHRAGFRVSDSERARYMFKFQFLRTAEPAPAPSSPRPALAAPELDPAELGPREPLDDVVASIQAWLRGDAWIEPGDPSPSISSSTQVYEQLQAARSEVERTSIAYSVGRGANWCGLLKALCDGSEAVARCAAYGLASAGNRVTPALIPLLGHESPRVRQLAAFALGEAACPSKELVDAFGEALRRVDICVFEVSALLQALASLASRCRAVNEDALCRQCVELSMPFLYPVYDRCSLSGENACLVVLMAAGARGIVSNEALHALYNIVNMTHDRYMICFAREVILRHEAAAAQSRRSDGSLPEQRGHSGSALEHEPPEAEERVSCEKKSRMELMPQDRNPELDLVPQECVWVA